MTRNDFYEKLHKKNAPLFNELVKRITKGFLEIISIHIDEPQPGHTRLTILLHEKEE